MGKKEQSTSERTHPTKKREYLSQAEVPAVSLDQALRVPRAIVENYAARPTAPLRVASALSMAPTSGPFRQLCGASIAYGLTEGGYNAETISIRPLAKRILQPTEEGDDMVARREALLTPRVIGEFLQKYRGSPLPQRHDIALNVLREMGVPSGRTESVYTLILEGAHSVGLIREIKDKQYVDLTGVSCPPSPDTSEQSTVDNGRKETLPIGEEAHHAGSKKQEPAKDTQPPLGQINRRVFITHGKNLDFVEPIKKLLAYGEMLPIVSVEHQSVSKPVPDKVMDDMRSCGAAIIHVEDEMTLIDQNANEHTLINPNVLIEIGAAIALFGRRFILLVKEGVTLPSNLQGLYEVRYKGDTLDGNTTIRLLEAINDIKNNPLPTR